MGSKATTPAISNLVLDASNFSFEVHLYQTRKAGGRNKSYWATHLLGVSSYIAELGGTDEEIAAGMLHDSVEDQPEAVVAVVTAWLTRMGDVCIEPPMTLEYLKDETKDIKQRAFFAIQVRFGLNVRSIIEQLTDDKLPAEWKTMPKAWRIEWMHKSRLAKFEKFRKASPSVLLVGLCDKLYNLRSLLQDRVENGPKMWSSFSAGRAETLWYYEELTKVAEEVGHPYLAQRMRKEFEDLKKVSEFEANIK